MNLFDKEGRDFRRNEKRKKRIRESEKKRPKNEMDLFDSSARAERENSKKRVRGKKCLVDPLFVIVKNDCVDVELI